MSRLDRHRLRNGRRGADEPQRFPARTSGVPALRAPRGEDHPAELFLGVLLQRPRHPDRGRRLLSAVRADAESHDRRL